MPVAHCRVARRRKHNRVVAGGAGRRRAVDQHGVRARGDEAGHGAVLRRSQGAVQPRLLQGVVRRRRSGQRNLSSHYERASLRMYLCRQWRQSYIVAVNKIPPRSGYVLPPSRRNHARRQRNIARHGAHFGAAGTAGPRAHRHGRSVLHAFTFKKDSRGYALRMLHSERPARARRSSPRA